MNDNKNNFQPPLYATIELSLAMGAVEPEDVKKIQDEGNIAVTVTENTENQVAIVLPYYSALDNIPSAAGLSEDDFENASGGFLTYEHMQMMWNEIEETGVVRILRRPSREEFDRQNRGPGGFHF